jgi:hypothetical protein
MGSGSAELSRLSEPTFENSEQVARSRVPILVSASEHVALPSAALELIANPSGSVVWFP